MKKTYLTICTCQHCGTAGATYFKQLDNLLCAKLKSQIELIGTTCGGECTTNQKMHSPLVCVNGERIVNATPAEILNAIHTMINPQRLSA